MFSTARLSERVPYRLEISDIPEDGPVDLFTEIIARETVNPPGNENALASYFVERFEASSVEFDIETQEVQPDRPNVIARAGDPAKGSLLLTGHMDVVPANPDDWSGDPFELQRENGRLIGRGTADMKGALAAKILATEAFLDKHDNTGEVILAFVVDEEVGGMGTEALIESGHSGRPDLATNAIDGVRRVLDQFKALDNEVRIDEHDLFTPGPTISITEIEGGLAHNSVPDEATATLDWRTLHDPDRGPEFFDEQLAEAIDDVSLDGDPIDVEYEREFFSPGSAVDPDARIVEATLTAAREVGIDADCTGFNAVSDARFLTQAGTPTLLFSPGSVENDAHTTDESITLDALTATAETYRRVLERFLQSD